MTAAGARDSLDIFWHGTPSLFPAPLVAAV